VRHYDEEAAVIRSAAANPLARRRFEARHGVRLN
jgi:hypothetical protein